MSYVQLAVALADRNKAPHPEELRDFIEQEHAADLANFVAEWPPQDAWRVLDLLPTSRQADVYGYLPRDLQVEMADAVPRDRLARLVTEMNAPICIMTCPKNSGWHYCLRLRRPSEKIFAGLPAIRRILRDRS